MKSETTENKKEAVSLNGIMATTILPPGSTANDLQNAVDNSSQGDIIVISSNITLNSNAGIWINNGKDITIQSSDGNHWTLFQRQPEMYHFHVDRSNLILQNITIDGGNTGGTVYVFLGSLTLNDDVIVQNCVSSDVGAGLAIFRSTAIMNGNSIVRNNISGIRGGGAYLSPESTFTMNDNATITNCSVTSNTNSAGGGVYANESTFTMNDNATITECSSIVNGGGVYIQNSTFLMNGGNITKNTADSGAGIYINIGDVTIDNTIISENIATTNGGGIYLTNNGNVSISNSSIINNTAQTGDGGGIYTENIKYENISTEETTIFDGNIASTDETPPRDVEILYPNIKFESTSISTHPLNNYDINYAAVYNIEYNANGGIGGYTTDDIEDGSIVTALSLEDTGIQRENYKFIGWNTNQDGSGDSYQPGNNITVNDYITLYAQWEQIIIHTVDFESNGGNHIDSQTVLDGETATKPIDPTRSYYIFGGWYTINGTTANWWDFNTPITEDITLYAKWIRNPNYITCCAQKYDCGICKIYKKNKCKK